MFDNDEEGSRERQGVEDLISDFGNDHDNNNNVSFFES
jgi:hypothetical protein